MEEVGRETETIFSPCKTSIKEDLSVQWLAQNFSKCITAKILTSLNLYIQN